METLALFEIVALVVVGVLKIFVVTTIMIQIDLFDKIDNTSFCQFVFTYIFSLNSFLVEIGPFFILALDPRQCRCGHESSVVPHMGQVLQQSL